jgi:hypothetical protein
MNCSMGCPRLTNCPQPDGLDGSMLFARDEPTKPTVKLSPGWSIHDPPTRSAGCFQGAGHTTATNPLMIIGMTGASPEIGCHCKHCLVVDHDPVRNRTGSARPGGPRRKQPPVPGHAFELVLSSVIKAEVRAEE